VAKREKRIGEGRPTKYKPEYCQMLIDHMNGGYSFESFAGLIGVAKQTLYEWIDANSEFLDAKEVGFEKSRLFWEKVGVDYIINQSSSTAGVGSESKAINSTVYIFNLKNRFPKEWRDRQEVEHSGKIDGFQIEIVNEKASK
jgi:hypothetical protein